MAALRLSPPPLSTGTALPFQIVPRASVSSSRGRVRAATASANQVAGAKTTSAASAPHSSPAQPQRAAALRRRSQASWASELSAWLLPAHCDAARRRPKGQLKTMPTPAAAS